jgi:hypothetical protein
MRFFVLVFCTDRTHICQIIRLLNVFNFVLDSPIYSNFLTFGGDSVNAESHSSSTESMTSETLRKLSQCRVRLHVN